jgi:ATP-dependent RNA helicase DDX6/DHH1
MAKFTKVKVGLLIGGTSSATEDLNMFDEIVHIVVGTTGRVKEIIRRRPTILNECRFFVLDEADKLVSNDFQFQIEDILDRFKELPQILMYSATFPVTIKTFKQKYLPKAEVLNCMDELMLLGLTHYYILVEEKQKIMALNTIYAKLVINQCIIFCSSVQRVEMLSRKLKEKGY